MNGLLAPPQVAHVAVTVFAQIDQEPSPESGLSGLAIAVPEPQPGTNLSHDEVLEVGNIVTPRLVVLLHGIVANLH